MQTFCEECHDIMEYQIKDIRVEKLIKGQIIKVEGKKANCSTCKNDLFVAEIHDYNLAQIESGLKS